MTTPENPSTPRPVPTISELFWAFTKIALFGFGGVLVWARRVIVQEKKWLSAEEFNAVLALCQVLPGPNVVNFSVMYGSRCAGIRGALAALFGLLLFPVVLMIVAGTLYARYGHLPQLQGMLAGLAAAAAGLLIATALEMAKATTRAGLKVGHVVAAATFVAAGIFRLPLLAVMAVAVPISIAAAWWETR